MRGAQQLRFFDDFNKSFAHGGEYSIGKRKTRRPITTKKAMHVTLRSTHATGKLSFLKKENASLVKFLLSQLSKRHHVRVYRYAINGNHLHLLIQGQRREGIQNFFRVFSGQLAERLTKAQRGHAFHGKFWDNLLFSRIVEWGKAFTIVCKYILQNELEAHGLIPYSPRKKITNPRVPRR
jgi:REP element-mobilizing transposase RayT